MKLHLGHRISSLVLAALFAGLVTPYALHAQNAPDQSSAPTTTTSKKHTKKATATDTSSSTGTAASSSTSTTTSTNATPKTTTSSSSSVQAQTPPSPGMMWINTSSGVYHKPGTRWYGKTKQGKWMTEADARKPAIKLRKSKEAEHE